MFRAVVAIVVLAGIALAGAVAYVFLKPPAEATGPVEAIPLQLETAGEARDPAAAAPTVFEIESEQSEARFIVDEVLRGEPNTVVGTTDQVAGQIALDLSQPSSPQLGTILINARTLTTDESGRNRMLRNFILGTDEHEYISFTATALHGLPATGVLGQPYTFQIVGELTIRDVTREVTFDATVTPVSASELSGSTSTTIRYADWDISIPQVPSVAGVSDDVRLELEFVATSA